MANLINLSGYTNLPDGYTILAAEWNDAMSQIESCINNHAKAINQKSGEPFLFDINDIQHAWQGPENDLYYYTLLESIHNKGLRPTLRVFDQEGHQLQCSPIINPKTGDITIYSNGPIILHLEVK